MLSYGVCGCCRIRITRPIKFQSRSRFPISPVRRLASYASTLTLNIDTALLVASRRSYFLFLSFTSFMLTMFQIYRKLVILLSKTFLYLLFFFSKYICYATFSIILFKANLYYDSAPAKIELLKLIYIFGKK